MLGAVDWTENPWENKFKADSEKQKPIWVAIAIFFKLLDPDPPAVAGLRKISINKASEGYQPSYRMIL